MANPTWFGSGTITSGTGTVTPALPSSIVTNDILLLFVETANQAASISNQAGGSWVEVTGSPQGTGTAGGTAATRLTIFWSRYNGTQTAPTLADPGDHIVARIGAIRGCVTSGNPWDVSAGDVQSTADTSVEIPGATTTVADCLVVAAAATGFDAAANGTAEYSGWTNANLTSLAERIDNIRIPNNGGSIGVATGIRAAAGGYGTTTATVVNSHQQARISIALKPPSLTNYTLTAAGGSFVETGTAASLEAGHRVAAVAGSLIESGSPAGLRASRLLPSGSGSLLFTGQDAALSKGRTLAAAAGAFAETGSSVTLKALRRILPEAGFFIEVGSAAGLRSSRRLLSGSGQFLFTGQEAALSKGRTLTAELGVLIVSGQAANLLRMRWLAAAPGNVAWSGAGAGLLTAKRLAAVEGSVAWTGTPAALIAARRIVAGAGEFAWVGLPATLVYTSGGFVIAAGTGAFLLTGSNARLVYLPLPGHLHGTIGIAVLLEGEAGPAVQLEGMLTLLAMLEGSIGPAVELAGSVAQAYELTAVVISGPD